MPGNLRRTTMNTCLSVILFAVAASNAFQTSHSTVRSTALYYYAEENKLKGPDFYRSYEDENDLHIPNRIGITTANWKNEEDTTAALSILTEAGVSFVSCENEDDEAMLGRAIKDQRYEVMVACSYNTRYKTGGGKSFIVDSLENSLDQLSSVSEVKLVQAKSSRFSLIGLNGIADGMLECIDNGDCEYAGAIDMGPGKLKGMVRKMERRDDTLASNQFEYSIVNRKNEKLIERCKNLGVIPLIRNPFGKNLMASGRWDSSNPVHKGTQRFSIKTLEKYEPLHSMLFAIAKTAQGRLRGGVPKSKKDEPKKKGKVTAAAVALNYIIAKGGVPLVDVHNEETAKELIGCLEWKLKEGEIEMLDLASEL